MTIDSLFSGLIGVVIGGVITCFYNEWSLKRKMRLEIIHEAYNSTANMMCKTSHSFSHVLTFLNTGIDMSEKVEYVRTAISSEAYINSYLSLIYDFGNCCTDLISIIHTRQLIFVNYRNYVNDLTVNMEQSISIMNEIQTMIAEENTEELKLKVSELNTRYEKYKEITWNLSIDLENVFSKVMKVHINKNKIQ